VANTSTRIVVTLGERGSARSMRSTTPRSTSAADAAVSAASPKMPASGAGIPTALTSAATAAAIAPIGRPSATTQPDDRDSSAAIVCGHRHGVECTSATAPPYSGPSRFIQSSRDATSGLYRLRPAMVTHRGASAITTRV